MPKVVDKVEDAPEEYREFYEEITEGENKGKFQLQNIGSLKNALNHERTGHRDAKAKAKEVEAWKGLGKTPEEIRALLDAQQTEEERKNREKGDHEAILRQKQAGWDTERGTLTAEVDTWRTMFQNNVVETKLTGALAKFQATEEGMDLLPNRLKSRVDTKLVDGKVVTRILQEDGSTPMAGSAPDGSATFDDLAKEVVRKYPSLFKGTGGTGSGASNTGGKGGGAASGKKRSEMNISEKAAFQREHGQAAYLALPM